MSHIVLIMPGDKTQVIMMLALPSGVESITCNNSGRSSLPLSSPWRFPGLFQSRLHLHTKMSSGEYLRQGLKIRCGVKIQMAMRRDTSPGIVLLYQVREVSPEPHGSQDLELYWRFKSHGPELALVYWKMLIFFFITLSPNCCKLVICTLGAE